MSRSPAKDYRAQIEKDACAVERQLADFVRNEGRLAVVQAPPGSGKTRLLIKTVVAGYEKKMRIAVATQTNSQADDICRRLAKEYPSVPACRFASSRAVARDLGSTITWCTNKGDLPQRHCVVVGTAAKWGAIDVHYPYDTLFVEEAWQLSWADFMLLGQVAPRFVLIGDPGQIPPVVGIDVARWETSPRPPHFAAPIVIMSDVSLGAQHWRLPASHRLPHDAVELVKRFYNFDFSAWSAPGERAVLEAKVGRSVVGQAVQLLAASSVVAITMPTPDDGPPVEADQEIANLASDTVKHLLKGGVQIRIGDVLRTIKPEDIGISATHRTMNSALGLAMPDKVRGKVVVDTPERWQGLERPVMIVVHPLSGVTQPSSFDLETGRLCVMASRHLAGLIILGRDHVGETLRNAIPVASQPVGRADVTGRGLFDNLTFWENLESTGRVVRG